MKSGIFKNAIYKMLLQIVYLLYMYEEHFSKNNFSSQLGL